MIFGSVLTIKHSQRIFLKGLIQFLNGSMNCQDAGIALPSQSFLPEPTMQVSC